MWYQVSHASHIIPLQSYITALVPYRNHTAAVDKKLLDSGLMDEHELLLPGAAAVSTLALVEIAVWELGRCHTNYDIQIIAVILKVTTRFFQQLPWFIGKIIMIVLGSHMLNMNYEVYCGSASVELTQ